MEYKKFLEDYANKNNFHFSQIDENTFKMNSRNSFIKMYFRDNETYLEGWGCFIEFAESYNEQQLSTLLDNALKNKKIIFGLDINYNAIEQEEVDLNFDVKSFNLTNEIKYILESDFYSPAKFYRVENNAVIECELPKIENQIENIASILQAKGIKYKIQPVYMGELECFNQLIIEKVKTYLRVTTNFCGSFLKIEEESLELDFSIYKCKTFNLNEINLADIDFY